MSLRAWTRWDWLAVAAAAVAFVEQSAFNVLRCHAPGSEYRLLVLVVLVPALLLLLWGNPRAAFASAFGQWLVLGWFNATRCQTGEFAGESGFVGGLGVLYTLVFSLVVSAVLGGVMYLLDRKARRGPPPSVLAGA